MIAAVLHLFVSNQLKIFLIGWNGGFIKYILAADEKKSEVALLNTRCYLARTTLRETSVNNRVH